ncbi:MAG: glycosyltransferase family 4 protein [Candidatus Hydrogenedentes bacterium]|nr:glycosyltransferase family 4 protein [Candidatus Hydrogenedentota bacterium]
MKILIPTIDYPPIEGGIATVALQTARELAALGHEVTVVAPAFPDMAAFDADEPYTVLRFPGYGLGYARLFGLFMKCRPLLRQTDLILAINVAYGGIIGHASARRLGKPVINFAYAFEFLKFRNLYPMRLLLNRIYRCSHRTIAISNYTAHSLINFGAPAEKISVVRPGASLRAPHPEDELHRLRFKYEIFEKNVILAVGRFIPRKGHLKLVSAMPAILEREPHTQLVMVGRGPCHEECMKKAAALGIEHLVVCPGFVPQHELDALYQMCTLFALPTGDDGKGQVEGFGLVYTEAHAWGKPVVAARSGGVTDAVKHNVTGLLVDGDDAAALEQAILRILQDPALAQSLGEKGLQRVKDELNWAHFARRIVEIAPGGPPA